MAGKKKKTISPDPQNGRTNFSTLGVPKGPAKKNRAHKKMTGAPLGVARNPWIQHIKAAYKPPQRPGPSREHSNDGSLVGGTSSGSGALEPTNCNTRNRTSYIELAGTGGSADGFQQTQQQWLRKHAEFLVRFS